MPIYQCRKSKKGAKAAKCGCFIECLTCWLIHRLVALLNSWLIDWLIDWLTGTAGRNFNWAGLQNSRRRREFVYLNKNFPLEKWTYAPAVPDWLTVAVIVVTLNTAFLLSVILSGSQAALPDVGTCSFMEYFCDARKCQTDFYKGLQKDPNGACRYSKVYNS